MEMELGVIRTDKYKTHYIEIDKGAKLNISAHYSDLAYAEGKMILIFTDNPKSIEHLSGFVPGHQLLDDSLLYVYSDRLSRHPNFTKANTKAAYEINPQSCSCLHYELLLSYIFEKKVTIGQIFKGVNMSTGYDFLLFGYRFV